ncbi:MAG: hypothetical protein JXB88_02355 [Spirochaetales bacterium]|nr:hypothetical protein [Spirochaetales bacterium]
MKNSFKLKRILYICKHEGDIFIEEKKITLDLNTIKEKAVNSKIKFNPSAIAIHPVTKDMYVLSSSDRLLAVCDSNGTVKEAYMLDPDIFYQPEGISFYPNGDMLISNEGNKKKKTSPGNILLFLYKK